MRQVVRAPLGTPVKYLWLGHVRSTTHASKEAEDMGPFLHARTLGLQVPARSHFGLEERWGPVQVSICLGHA